MSHGRSFGELTQSDLKLAQRLMVNIIRAVAESGRDVIVDNTHLSTKFPNLVRDELGDIFQYIIKDFTEVPLSHCIVHDEYRTVVNPGAYVGAEEVTRLWNQGRSLQHKYGGPGLPAWQDELNRSDGIEPYKPDTSLPKAVLVDVDGTLALARSRSPYDTSRYLTDELEQRLAQLVRDLTAAPEPYQTIVVTGRFEDHREILEEWLERERVYPDEIYMRSSGDTRRDNIVKLELFNANIRSRFNVIAAFDDRDRVVRLWRRLGLLTLQPNYGDF